MKKLVEGIVRFRREMRPGYREQFAHLALDQSPNTLFIACSDSRVVPNTFASTLPDAGIGKAEPGSSRRSLQETGLFFAPRLVAPPVLIDGLERAEDEQQAQDYHSHRAQDRPKASCIHHGSSPAR